MTPPHLDDEVLSAVLDGEATPEDSAHADTCAECGARLAALRDASLLVRSPVPPADPTRRDAAIAAALGAATSNVVPLQRRRTPPAWLGAAAAIVVAVAAVGLLARASGDDDDFAADSGDDTSALGTVAGGDEAEALADAALESATAAGPPPVYDAGDLGPIDIDVLQDQVRAALDGSSEESFQSGPTDADTADDGSDAGGAATGSSSARSEDGAAPCEDTIRTGNPGLGLLVFRATGTFDDAPMSVLAFDVARDDGAVDRWVYVAAMADCSIRNQQTFAA